MPFPTEPRHVDAAERVLGVSFPAEYRARILRENGGEIELEGVGEIEDDGWWLYPVRDDSTPRHLARSHDDVVRQTQLAAGQDLPHGAVVIGEDGCGNLLLLLPRDEGAAALEPCVWDHETGELTRLSLAQVFAAPGPRSAADFHASIDGCFPYLHQVAAPALIDEALAISPAAVFAVVHELARRPRDSGVPDAVCLALLERIAARFEHPLAEEVLAVARTMVAGGALPFAECERLMRRIAAFPGQFAALNVVCCACDEAGMGDADRLHDEITTAWGGGE